ncbi:hypothetical protein EDD15DRAFT_2521325 [Pisolithus albus]|nr:hypothetical protein EDD15DRAFT_2521325 [Pisolithus albus]
MGLVALVKDTFDKGSEDKAIIALIGSSDSSKSHVRLVELQQSYLLTTGQFIGMVTSRGRTCSASDVTATEVTLRDKKVILLNPPDIGSVVNGRVVMELDILNHVKRWLQKSRCNAPLAGILYFQRTDNGQAVRPDIDCFREICDPTSFYSSVVLVATSKRLTEAGESETRKDAVRQEVRRHDYLGTKESAEAAILFSSIVDTLDVSSLRMVKEIAHDVQNLGRRWLGNTRQERNMMYHTLLRLVHTLLTIWTVDEQLGARSPALVMTGSTQSDGASWNKAVSAFTNATESAGDHLEHSP